MPYQQDDSSGANANFAGQATQSGSDLGSSIASLIISQRETQASRMNRHVWESAIAPINELMSGMYYAPGAAQGGSVPYSWRQGGSNRYQWAPTQSMQNIYSGYLGRQYGLPDSVSRSMVAQSLSPLRINTQGLLGARTAGQVSAGTQTSPGALAQAMLNSRQVGVLNQQDYLRNAAQLAAFNLWRAQELGRMIG